MPAVLLFRLIMFQKKLEERTQTVDSTELKVYGIERTINSSVDLPTTWQSYFMEDWYVCLRHFTRFRFLSHM